ncbi:hypothetical protein VOLCADRAFT_47893, partial [Volvox carteri f. nagariensis]
VFLTGRSEDARSETEANLADAGYGKLRCYTELLMRPVGDEGLASVVKSAARARLVAAGHVLVGNIGDQFSDLVGEAAAVANFKLPNPV